MRIRSFDCLRGYGVLTILLVHLPQLGTTLPAYYLRLLMDRFMLPYIFLDVFFAMSGFLITRIIIKEKEKGTFSFKKFYYRRSIRIFPIYYLTIILVTLIISSKGNLYAVFYLSNYYFTFFQDPHPLMHTWTLSVEEHFYLLWPVILMLFNLKTCRIIIGFVLPLLAFLTIILLPVFLSQYTASSLIYNSTNTRCLAISLGSFLAFHEAWLHRINKLKFLKIAGLSILVYITYLVSYKLPLLKSVPHYVLVACFLPVLSVLLLMLTHKTNFIRENIFKKIALNGPVNYVGKISYGLYLYHYPVFFFFGISSAQVLVTNNLSLCLWACILSFVFAVISFHLIETPLMNYKKKPRIQPLMVPVTEAANSNRNMK